jgi:hypothetical protein
VQVDVCSSHSNLPANSNVEENYEKRVPSIIVFIIDLFIIPLATLFMYIKN